MYILSILDTSGDTLWTEEYRSIKGLRNRAPDAICELDNNYAAYVDELVMVPSNRGFSTNPVGVTNARVLC